MEITLEMVERLREKASVSYAEAKQALEYSEGNLLDALIYLEEKGNLPIPVHLQDAHYKGAAKLGHGLGYLYAHDYPNHYVKQQYLPYELSGREFYRPSGNGYEVKIKEHMKRLKEAAG